MPNEKAPQPDRRSVFVVHGRNMPAKKAMFEFLRALGLRPIEWEQAVKATGTGAPYIGEVLNTGFGIAQAAVVVLTGDDLGRLRPEFQLPNDPPFEKNLTPQPRLNVVFEAGMALARFPERTILVELGETRQFSDIAGRHVLKFQGNAEDRDKLRIRLKTTGCDIDEHSQEWLKAGDFQKALLVKQQFSGMPSTLIPHSIPIPPPPPYLPDSRK